MNDSSDVREETGQRNILLAALVSIFALASSSQYFADKQKADASLSWPGTLATVESNGIDSIRGSGFVPFVNYSYRVGDRSFKSSDTSYPSQHFSNRSDAEAFIAKYPVDRQVAVFYDPKEPSHACLVAGETGSQNQRIWTIFVQFAAAILCFFLPPGMLGRRRVGSNALFMIQPSSKDSHH